MRSRSAVVARWIDGTEGLSQIEWKGIGGSGRYRIDIYAAAAAAAQDFNHQRSNKEKGLAGVDESDPSNPWRVLGGYEADLNTSLGRTMFGAGSKFLLEGDSALGIVLTRLDHPFAIVDDITIKITR